MNDNIERLCKELLHYDDMIFGWEDTVNRVAEAIVRECVAVAAKHDARIDWVGPKIKEHFGIEP
jgi:hypothetical protein